MRVRPRLGEAPEKPEKGSGIIGGIGALRLEQEDLGCLEGGRSRYCPEISVFLTQTSNSKIIIANMCLSARHDSTCSTDMTSPLFTGSP